MTLSGRTHSCQVLVGQSNQEASLVARELEILGRDRVFEDTVRFLDTLVQFS